MIPTQEFRPPPQATTLLRDGAALVRAGDAAKGRLVLRQVVALDPASEAGWLWLAHAAADPDEKTDCFRRVLRLNPANEHARVGLSAHLTRAGIDAAVRGSRGTARTALREAVGLNPANEAALVWLAGVVDTDVEAEDCLRRVLEVNPDNEQAKKGMAYYTARRTEWTCPVCRKKAPDKTDQCPNCRSIATLADPTAFDAPTGADPNKTARAAETLREQYTRRPSAVTGVGLALALLNLGHHADAVAVLEDLVEKFDLTGQLRGQVDACLIRLWAREAEKARRVMVVDDSPTVRRLVTSTLEAAGYWVVAVADGDQVDEAIRLHGPPGLFVLDINMPGKDGFEVAQDIRQRPETSRVPFVFLTGQSGFLTKLHSKWVGAANFLKKPFRAEELVKAIDAVVGAARRRK
jgi:twitching motility two-component system response regulator PilG